MPFVLLYTLFDMMIDKRRDLLKIRVELMGISPPIWREKFWCRPDTPSGICTWLSRMQWAGWITISTSSGSGGIT